MPATIFPSNHCQSYMLVLTLEECQSGILPSFQWRLENDLPLETPSLRRNPDIPALHPFLLGAGKNAYIILNCLKTHYVLNYKNKT